MTAVTRRFVWIAAVLGVLAVAVLSARLWLGPYVVRSVLRMAGASEIRLAAVRGTPWQVEIENLSFRVRTQPFSARKVTLRRDRWWQASLGDVRVEGARLPVVLDGTDVDPWNWKTYDEGLGDEPVQPPFRSLDLDGDLVVRMGTLEDMSIGVRLEGRPKSGTEWTGTLVAEGPGFRLAGDGELLRAGQELDFRVHRAELDLEVWSRHVQRLVILPGGLWTLGGRLTGVAEGRVTAKRFAATARVQLHDGRMRVGMRDIEAAGATAELEFSDLWKLRTKTAGLRLERLRVGRLDLREITADFGLWDGRQITVDRAAARVPGGGRLGVDAFRYRLDQRALALRLHPSDIDAAHVLRLTHDLKPRLRGRVGGELDVRIHSDGVQVDGGFLALDPDGGPELQFSASAAVRSGAVMNENTTRILKEAGNQSVVVRLDRFRLGVRGADLPLGTSARVDVEGTVDGEPVALAYLVNGAIERYVRIMP